VSLFITESESETDASPTFSKYIHNVLTREVSHDPTFGVYQDDTNGAFKIGRSSFKYNDKHVFVDGQKYKATQGLWELLTQSRPDKNLVTHQDRQAYKQILLQSNTHRVNYSPSGKIKANKGLKYMRFYKHKGSALGIVELIIRMSQGNIYYDPKHPALAKLVKASKNKKRDVEGWLSGSEHVHFAQTCKEKVPS